ncbi:cytochrome P450 [Streptomyces sp. JJ36]|uniref:cytochrome P450 n=1 Tax=Streptomyces sp. JJ36 TaxID=2736645 RepID=UPI001F3EBB14|nr:cytochrome P450 [Streptomyces sp. JJ36]MCF6525280.1 cytochrome P450 [Streptomyces sp. JJ36]
MTTPPDARPGAPAGAAPPPGCPAHAAGAGDTAVPLSGPRFHTDPAQLYREMRRDHGPVVPVTLPGEVPAWLVIGYRELYQVTSDPVLFPRDSGLWNQWEHLPEDWPLRPMIGQRQPSVYYTVGEEHRRHLRLVQDALESVGHIELRRECEELADGLIDGFCGRGEADLVAEYAKPLPVLVLARLLGIPDADGPALTKAMSDLADGGADALEGFRRFGERLHRLVAEKHARPGADVTSRMLAYPEAFTDEEYALDLMAVTAAGHLPTADWIGNSVRLMLTDERFAASLTGGRHSVPEAMNEVLWEDTPTQILAGRWAARDTWLGDRRIGAGDMLLLGLAGANGDPQVHVGTPGSDDGFRNGNSAHFSFSHGEFQCPFPAREIAEVIARSGIEVLLDRLPDIDLAVPARTLVRRPSAFLRGMTVLPVRFSPAPPVGGRA